MARELILDEVFIHDELNEIPYTLYYDYENKFFIAINEEGKTRYFKFKKPISEFSKAEREQIMEYNYSFDERPKELSLDDVFVEGSMVEEVDESDVLFTKEALTAKLQEIEDKYQKDKRELLKKFADNNNPYSNGGVFTDHIGSIVIEKITYNLYPYNGGLPCCAFFGKELKKDGTPKKNGSARLAYQSNDIKKKF